MDLRKNENKNKKIINKNKTKTWAELQICFTICFSRKNHFLCNRNHFLHITTLVTAEICLQSWKLAGLTGYRRFPQPGFWIFFNVFFTFISTFISTVEIKVEIQLISVQLFFVNFFSAFFQHPTKASTTSLIKFLNTNEMFKHWSFINFWQKWVIYIPPALKQSQITAFLTLAFCKTQLFFHLFSFLVKWEWPLSSG